MPATARIEAEVWGDVRFRVLAKQLGCDWYSAIGRMAALWGECTNRCVYVLDAVIVAMYLECEVEAVEAILCRHAQLGEAVPDGIRIKGTEGRVEWLHKARASGRKGGKARAANASRDGGKFVTATTVHQGPLEGFTRGPPRVHQGSTSPTATATATATATEQDLCASKSHEEAKTMTKRERDKHAGHALGAAVTRDLNAKLNRHGSKAFDPMGQHPRSAGKRWIKAGWDRDLVTQAVELRCVDLADNQGGRYLRPSTLFNTKLSDYVAMVREGMTPGQLRAMKSKPNGSHVPAVQPRRLL